MRFFHRVEDWATRNLRQDKTTFFAWTQIIFLPIVYVACWIAAVISWFAVFTGRFPWWPHFFSGCWEIFMALVFYSLWIACVREVRLRRYARAIARMEATDVVPDSEL